MRTNANVLYTLACGLQNSTVPKDLEDSAHIPRLQTLQMPIASEFSCSWHCIPV